jgi:uncharacterized protein (DUF2141 family)
MKRRIITLSTLSILFVLSVQASDLSLEVTLPAQKQGVVRAAVFEKGEGFPRGKPLMNAMAKPVNGKAVLQFTGLPAGDYAATAYLDENSNQNLDTNLFGLPTEPYGFSRNARGAMGPPHFADAAFRVDADNAKQAFELK